MLTLATGSIWARISWGVWWTWGERQLVLFLILFLFYSAYFMLRFSIDPGPRRSRTVAVYALFGVALIPISFLAIRLAENASPSGGFHPRRDRHDGRDVRQLPGLPRRDARPRLRSTTRSSPASELDLRLRELRKALA